MSSWDDTCDRIVLNYKGIPHKTEWVEFPDIAKVAKRIGAPHTFLRRGGEPLYTVPILRDPTTDQCLAGSLQIALNLERLYPHSPKLFPPGTEDQITDFDNKFYRSVATALARCSSAGSGHSCTTMAGARTTSVRRASACSAGLSSRSPRLVLPPMRAGSRCVRRWSRLRGMRMRA